MSDHTLNPQTPLENTFEWYQYQFNRYKNQYNTAVNRFNELSAEIVAVIEDKLVLDRIEFARKVIEARNIFNELILLTKSVEKLNEQYKTFCPRGETKSFPIIEAPSWMETHLEDAKTFLSTVSQVHEEEKTKTPLSTPSHGDRLGQSAKRNEVSSRKEKIFVLPNDDTPKKEKVDMSPWRVRKKLDTEDEFQINLDPLKDKFQSNLINPDRLKDMPRAYIEKRFELDTQVTQLISKTESSLHECQKQIEKLKIELAYPCSTEQSQNYHKQIDLLMLEIDFIKEKYRIESETLSSNMDLLESLRVSGALRDSPSLLLHQVTPDPIPNTGGSFNNDSLVEALYKCFGEHGKSERKLTDFDGTPSQWSIFYNTFLESTSKYKIQKTENIKRLKCSLRGNALRDVEHLLCDGENVPKIIDILKRRYGQPEGILNFLVQKAKETKQVEAGKPETLIDFSTAVSAIVENARIYNQMSYLNDRGLLMNLVNKLPLFMKSKWYEFELSLNEVDLTHFYEFIDKQTKIAERMRVASSRETYTNVKKEEKVATSKKFLGTNKESNANKKELYCIFCARKNHHLQTCRTFDALSLPEKLEKVKSLGVCYLCLRKNHLVKDCKLKTRCANCKRNHHVTLCQEEKRKPEKTNNYGESSKNGNSSSITTISTIKTGENMLWYIPVKVFGPEGEKYVTAMFDSGSPESYVTEKLANQLGIVGPKKCVEISTFNGKKEKYETMTINLHIAGDYKNSKIYEMKRVKTLDRLNLPYQGVNIDTLQREYPHLRGALLRPLKENQPQLIIGLEHWHLGQWQKVLSGKPDSPKAIHTKLGWMVIGKAPIKTNKTGLFHIHEDMIKEFICLDNTLVTDKGKSRSREDILALKILEETTTFSPKEKRWTTGLLWREKDFFLPSSEDMSMKRLYYIERRMDRDPEFSQLVQDKFNDYINKGYLVPVRGNTKNEKRWFLPTFIAYHPSKKPRLVYDAAAKAGGKSFNDFLYTGPDLLRPLASVLMRFRMYKIGITADIREMFHQVKLQENDRKFQTILYRGTDRKTNPIKYEMQVLFFGSVCSPTSAIYVKDKNTERFKDQYPAAVAATTTEMYMDDLLSGAETEEEAIKLQRDITFINSEGGFEIVKWSSSSIEVLNKIPMELKATKEKVFSSKSELPTEKTLGLIWDQSNDVFRFTVKLDKIPAQVIAGEKTITKRQLASFVMSLFDPLGFITPLKIKGLLLLQFTWKLNISWDEDLPKTLNEKFMQWSASLSELGNVSIPRCLSSSLKRANDIQLHVMCDASEQAYASAAYLRVQSTKIEVNLIAARAKLTPLKGMSIPRLELQGALMGVRLSKSIHETFGDAIKISKTYFWTDSKCVLCWIRSESGRFSQFVNNRLGEIMEATEKSQWKWVPSGENIADEATRLESNSDLSANSRWFKGPKFLSKNESEWPREKSSTPVKEEDLEKKVIMIMKREKANFLPSEDRFSSWYRLIKCTATLILSCRRFKKMKPFYITNEDIKKAELLWIKKAQDDSFSEEKRLLYEREPIPKSSKLAKLTPQLKEDLIILSGRINNAPFIEEETKQPIVLDSEHQYTKLLIKHYHERNHHQGHETVLNSLRQRFWILNGRNAVRKCATECGICRIKKTSPVLPLMGQLPAGRLMSNVPPFTHTGVDLFGPLFITTGRKHDKRWGILFTCLNTRAVYLDLLPSLSTSDFLDGLCRFNSRRGPAEHLYSDNGTNFRGADNELKAYYANLNETEIREKCLRQKIEWHFIPPSAPHMGGSWERLIGLTKKILCNILHERFPKEYTLLTFLAEVEGILNSRPLTMVSSDPEDPTPLTPNHLLKLKSIPGSIAPVDYTETDKYRKMWRYAQFLTQEFWRRWRNEYIIWLSRRSKWTTTQEPIQVGDIVLLLDDLAERSNWKRGFIEATYPSKDGQVRIVDVRVPTYEGKEVKQLIYKRPVSKICPLVSTTKN